MPGSASGQRPTASQRERLAIDILLGDATWIISGMIYGFYVNWIPPSEARNVPEKLIIHARANIHHGDEKLSTEAIVREDGFLHVQLEYRPDETQIRRLEGWQGQAFPTASGFGTASLYSNNPRREAIEEAMKEALRAWLRAREFNRPQEITGRMALAGFPDVGISMRNMRAAVRIKMDLEPLVHYPFD